MPFPFCARSRHRNRQTVSSAKGGEAFPFGMIPGAASATHALFLLLLRNKRRSTQTSRGSTQKKCADTRTRHFCSSLHVAMEIGLYLHPAVIFLKLRLEIGV